MSTASEPSWIAAFAGLSPRLFRTLVTVLRSEGADAVRKVRPWSLPLEDRARLAAAFWRTNLTMRQLAPLFWLVMPHRRSEGEDLPDRKAAHSKSRKLVRDRVEPVFARMKTWKLLRDCRLKGDGVHHAMLGIARMHGLALAGQTGSLHSSGQARGGS